MRGQAGPEKISKRRAAQREQIILGEVGNARHERDEETDSERFAFRHLRLVIAKTMEQRIERVLEPTVSDPPEAEQLRGDNERGDDQSPEIAELRAGDDIQKAHGKSNKRKNCGSEKHSAGIPFNNAIVKRFQINEVQRQDN